MAGFLYLFGMVTALVGTGTRAILVVPGEWAETVDNIAASKQMFRLGLASDLICFVSVVLLSLSLYVLLRTVHKNLAALGLLWRLGEAFVLAVNSMNAYAVATLVDGDHFGARDTQAMVQLYLGEHVVGYNIGMVFFGVGTAMLNYLLFRSNYVPRGLAIVGMVSSSAILVSAFVVLTWPDSSPLVQYVPYVPAFVFEVTVGVFLLRRAVGDRIAVPHPL